MSKKSKKNEDKGIGGIALIKDQEAQAKSLIEILKRSVVAFDMSMMGAGKTYVASEVAIRFGFKNIVVICPASVSGKWEEMRSFGLGSENSDTNLMVLSYEGLRSTTPRGLNLGEPRLLSHGLLYRKDASPFSELRSRKSLSPVGSKASSPKISLGAIAPTGGLGIPKTSGIIDLGSKVNNTEESEVSEKKVEFYPSEELISKIKEGCLFIFDEAQKIKNRNAQWLATRCIADVLLTSGGKSRFLLLSGTPIDKEEHAVNLMQMMGFIKSVKLYDMVDKSTDISTGDTGPGNMNLRSKTVKLIGAQELINFCMNVSENGRKTTEKIIRLLHSSNNFGLNSTASVREGVIHLCYKLFQEVIKKEITSSMAPPDLSANGVFLDIKNGYYSFRTLIPRPELSLQVPVFENSMLYDDTKLEMRKRELAKGIDALGRMMKTVRIGIPKHVVPTQGPKSEDFVNKFGLTKPLKMIETGKVPLFIRKAQEVLTTVPNSKVCIFVNYLENLAEIATAFGDLAIQRKDKSLNPILMYGSVPKEKRQAILKLFQKPDLEYRVYISILSVSATGIDLDDQSGLFPRYAFASPGFKIDELHQLTRRFYRANTKSSTVFRFVYAKGYEEVGLLNNLARKTTVMKETLEKQVAGGVKFPGEYVNDIEK